MNKLWTRAAWMLPLLALTACPTSDDTIPPTVAITSPASDQAISGTLSIQLDANDNVGVGRITVYMRGQGSTARGAIIGSAVSRPYVVSWNTSRVPNNANLELVAVAEDGAGNKGESTPVRIRSNNANVPVLTYLVAYTLPPNGIAPSAARANSPVLPQLDAAAVRPPVGTTTADVQRAQSRLRSSLKLQNTPLVNRSTVIEWAWQPFNAADGYGAYLGRGVQYVSLEFQAAVISLMVSRV